MYNEVDWNQKVVKSLAVSGKTFFLGYGRNLNFVLCHANIEYSLILGAG